MGARDPLRDNSCEVVSVPAFKKVRLYSFDPEHLPIAETRTFRVIFPYADDQPDATQWAALSAKAFIPDPPNLVQRRPSQ
jgi:hypothetical protein